MEPWLWVLLVIPLVIGIRLLKGGMDHDRVREYVEAGGGKVIDARWTPFGPGWVGEKSDRIYEVRYLDRDGNEHHAHCKTSLWTGVYFTQDRIVGQRRGGAEQSSLEDENRRLREELDRLRREQRSEDRS